jgi:hypothetical protein
MPTDGGRGGLRSKRQAAEGELVEPELNVQRTGPRQQPSMLASSTTVDNASSDLSDDVELDYESDNNDADLELAPSNQDGQYGSRPESVIDKSSVQADGGNHDKTPSTAPLPPTMGGQFQNVIMSKQEAREFEDFQRIKAFKRQREIVKPHQRSKLHRKNSGSSVILS